MNNEIIIDKNTYDDIREASDLLVTKANQIADVMFDLARKEELPNYYEDLCKCVVGRFTDENIHYINLIDGTEITLPAYLLCAHSENLPYILDLILKETTL